jgi:hypothetical protein
MKRVDASVSVQCTIQLGLVIRSPFTLPDINVLTSPIILSTDVAVTVCYTVLLDIRCLEFACC